jgi:energy-coupling factor transporter ATP-binding protein EcfA2
MLAAAMALMTKPKALLLDEPTAGLAPAAATSILATLRAINERLDTTNIMVEQNVLTALDVVERAMVLRAGQIVFDGQSGDSAARKTSGRGFRSRPRWSPRPGRQRTWPVVLTRSAFRSANVGRGRESVGHWPR